MFVLTILEVLLLVLYVGYLVNEYAQKEVPLYVKILTFISWIMSFGIVFILPHDIYYVFDHAQRQTNQLHMNTVDFTGFATLSTLWSVIYWSNFVLTWVVLPLFQEYEDAGEFTWKSKMWKSVKNNLILYGVFGLFGLAFFLYLTAINKLQLSAILQLVVALANCFGIFLVVVLLGYGLVEIPKTYWRNSNYELCLKNYRYEAVGVEEAKIAIQFELEDLAELMFLLKGKYENHPTWSDPIQEILQKVRSSLLKKIPYEIVELIESQGTGRDQSDRLKTEVGTLTLAKLSELHRKAKRLSAEYSRARTKWEMVCEETFLIEDLLENRYSVEKRVRSTLWQQRRGGVGKIVDTLSWCWYTKLKRIYLVSLFSIFTSLSVIILLGEISIFSNVDINILAHLLHDDYSFIRVQVAVLVPLIYISFCSYYGLFHIRLAGMYGFYHHQHTDAPSLLFGSINFSRVSFPLAYNFLQMMSVKEKTPFTSVIGDMNVIPLFGSQFSLILPILLILVSVFNFFDVYDKILSAMGLPQFQFHNQESEQRVEEGKKLLYKARIQRERTILNQNTNKGKFKNSYVDLEMQSEVYSGVTVSAKSTRDQYQYYAFQNLDEILKI